MTLRIPLALTADGPVNLYSISRFEELMGIRYFPHLVCANWRVERELLHKCAKTHAKGKIGALALWLGTLHGKALEEAAIPPIAIRWIAPSIGYGVFATQPLKAWAYLGEYTGILRHRPLFKPTINDYCFMYPKEWRSFKAFTIDSEKQGNYTRFINHSDTPNCESVAVFHEGLFHILFRTIKEIEEGEQLSYDYGNIYWRGRSKMEHP